MTPKHSYSENIPDLLKVYIDTTEKKTSGSITK